MKRVVFGLMVAMVAAQAQAVETKLGAFVGANSTEYKSDATSFDKATGLEVGVSTLIPIGTNLEIRTGVGYVEKRSEIDLGGFFGISNIEYTLGYVEVPATVMYSFNESISVLGGANLDVKVSDKCETLGGSCSINKAEDFVYSATLGGRANFGGANNMELLYEKGLSDLAEDLENEQSISVRYVYMF